MTQRSVRPLGEWAVLVECASVADAHAVRRAVLDATGDVEVVCGDGTVLVEVAPRHVHALDVAIGVATALAVADHEPAGRQLVEIAVRYDGPDLDDVAALTGLSTDEVVARHSGTDYTVAFLGFSPGFAYLDGVEDRLAAVPRLATPRKRTPAGAVAIAGGRAAVYPQATPGGWRILGHTDQQLFDPGWATPALLAPGDRVRFVPA